jgi:hypothetical protein
MDNIVSSEHSLGLLAERKSGFSTLIIASKEGMIGYSLPKQIHQILVCWWKEHGR